MADMRAPVEDGAVLAEPPLDQAGRLLAENRRRFASSPLKIFDRRLSDLQADVRRNAIDAARSYLDGGKFAWTETPLPSLIVTGHQPELFHPGVWVKHFAIHGLAKRHRAVPVNLIIDNDAPKSTFLRVPVFDSDHPRWQRASFDHWQRGKAYEETHVLDADAFTRFTDQVQPIIQHWPFVPMLPTFWREVVSRAAPTSRLDDHFVAARHAQEEQWGCRNLELPIRSLCGTAGFRLFAGYLFANIERFQEIYNEVLREYRTRHEVRSDNRPLPDLAKEADWLESPFWGWRPNGVRQRLWVRRLATEIELRAGNDVWPRLPVQTPQRLLQIWEKLEGDGFKIRTRALTTTLFARMFVADLFVHGIGGAIYDEIGDALMRAFFGIEPPRFMVVSATLRLPFPRFDASQDECRRLQLLHRDLQWNPQRHFDALPSVPDEDLHLSREKQRWINKACTTKAQRRERYRQLRSLNEQMRPIVTERSRKVFDEWQRCEIAVQANEIFGRRDYAFCLYPEEKLRELCVRFLE